MTTRLNKSDGFRFDADLIEKDLKVCPMFPVFHRMWSLPNRQTVNVRSRPLVICFSFSICVSCSRSLSLSCYLALYLACFALSLERNQRPWARGSNLQSLTQGYCKPSTRPVWAVENQLAVWGRDSLCFTPLWTICEQVFYQSIVRNEHAWTHQFSVVLWSASRVTVVNVFHPMLNMECYRVDPHSVRRVLKPKELYFELVYTEPPLYMVGV